MIFQHFPLELPGQEPNVFLVGCDTTREALLVDVGAWTPAMAAALRGHDLRLTTIFLTHGHWDHVDGLADAIAATGATPYSYTGRHGGIETRRIRPGEELRVGTLEGRVVHTPGHTDDGLSLILPGHVFTGDALFCGSVGGTGSRADYDRQIAAIREYLFVLPDHFEIHCGHGPSSTIGVERAHNPFFV